MPLSRWVRMREAVIRRLNEVERPTEAGKRVRGDVTETVGPPPTAEEFLQNRLAGLGIG